MRRQYMFPTLSSQPFLCFPESVGWYREFPEHQVSRPAGSLNNFNIHYVENGTGYVELDGNRYTLRKGDAVLYLPLQPQRYYSSEDDPWDVRWVHFYGEGLVEYCTRLGLHEAHLYTLRQPDRWVSMHLQLLEEAETNGLLHKASLSTLTYALLAEFVHQAEPFARSLSSLAAERVAELLPLLQQEACRPFVLEEWAARAGVSSYYFCKLFRKLVQMTPMDFITLCRLQQAKQWLLERKEASVRDIAAAAGYPTTSYFNKRFLEHEGMTPTEYRELHM